MLIETTSYIVHSELKVSKGTMGENTCMCVDDIEMHLFCALTPTALCSVCVDRGNGEEESAPVCDLPGADSQADQHCRVGDMCWAVQPQWPGDVRVYFRVSKKQIIYCRWILPNPISKYNHTSHSLPSVDLARGGERLENLGKTIRQVSNSWVD